MAELFKRTKSVVTEEQSLSEEEKEIVRENIGVVETSEVANALRKTMRGTALRADDVSPLAHNLSVVQYGQCVQDGTPTPAAPVAITGKAAGGTVGDGTAITQTLTVTDANGDPVTLYGLPVSSGGNVTIGGRQYVADTLEGTTVTRRIGSEDLGTLQFMESSQNATRKVWKALAPMTSNVTPPSGLVTPVFMCSRFVPVPSGNVWTPGDMSCSGEGYRYLTLVTDTSYSTVDELKTLVTGTLLYYQLATPTTENVTLSPATLAANSPTTTWTSEAHSEVTYNRDANKALITEPQTLTDNEKQTVRDNIGAASASPTVTMVITFEDSTTATYSLVGQEVVTP